MGVPRGGSCERAWPRLDPQNAEYFRRALETLQEGLGPEDLVLFTTNVLSEVTSVSPLAVALDRKGSLLLQQLLPKAPLALLTPLMAPLLQGGLEGAAGNPLGARVLEVALGRVLPALSEAMGQTGGDVEQLEATMEPLEATVGQLVATIAGDPVGFAQHPNGSFVLRELLRLLGGCLGAGNPKEAGPKAKSVGPGVEGAELPPSFPPLLGQLAEAFQENLPSLLTPASASLCLQVALQVLHHSQSDACSRLCDALIGHLLPPSPDPTYSPLRVGLQDPLLSRVLEVVIAVAGPQRLRRLFEDHLRGHLRSLATHPVANHGLQRLLDHAPAELVEEVLSELGPTLPEPLAQGYPGVLIALAAACRRHPSLQQRALQSLLQALDCWEPPERRQLCIRALAGLCPLEVEEEMKGMEPKPWKGPITPQGSLILQHLLHFRDPKLVLGGLQALPPASAVALAQSPPGSRVWDALMESPCIPKKVRRRLLRKLQGQLVSLACHRNGSRVLDTIWATLSTPARAAMAQELASHLPELRRDPHGRGIIRNFGLEQFLRRKKGLED